VATTNSMGAMINAALMFPPVNAVTPTTTPASTA
jgi:hypothetical protein